MKQVAVLIPVYRNEIDSNESIAFRSFRKHLGGYDIIYICPESLQIDAYLEFFPHAAFQRFDDRFFRSLKTYSNLLELPEFYRRFSDYEYVLICQPDCLIFRDELKYWCEQGFSYIGPPWHELNFIGGNKRKWFQRVPFIKKLFPTVGNGGLSLRNVKIHIKLAKRYRILSCCFFWLHEDLFWCGVVGRLDPTYRIPKRSIAMAFAVEALPEKSVQELEGRLPFGCHAWNKNSPEYWLRIAQETGLF